jgi:hypothetical protein
MLMGSYSFAVGLANLDLIIQEGAQVRVDVMNGLGRTELVAGLDVREVSGVGILNTAVWETPNLHMANRPMSISLLGHAHWGVTCPRRWGISGQEFLGFPKKRVTLCRVTTIPSNIN